MKLSKFFKPSNRRGFSLVELLVVIAIIGVLSTVAYVAIQRTQTRSNNNRMLDDLIAVANAMEQYKQDNLGKYPALTDQVGENMNVNCYNADATYAHDAETAAFCQGYVDNIVLGKKYLQEVPTDPRTQSRYVYGVSQDQKFFQVAGLYETDSGAYEARTVENLARGYSLPSLVRAFDSPDFVTNRGDNLPYNPDARVLVATIQNSSATVSVNSAPAAEGQLVSQNDTIVTDASGTADLYFSDGSISTLEPDTSLTLENMEVAVEEGFATKIKVKLNAGKIWNKIVRLASNSEFRVETTSAIAGVRGTEFSIDADDTVVVNAGDVYQTPIASEPTKAEAIADQVTYAPIEPDTDDYATGTFYNENINVRRLRNIHRPHVVAVSAGVVTIDQIDWLNPGGPAIEFDRIIMQTVDQALDPITGEQVPDYGTPIQVSHTPITDGYDVDINSQLPQILPVVFRFEKGSYGAPGHRVTAPSHPPLLITTETSLSETEINPVPEASGPQMVLSGANSGIVGGDNIEFTATLTGYDFQTTPALTEVTTGGCTTTAPTTIAASGVAVTVNPPSTGDPTVCSVTIKAMEGGEVLAERTWQINVADEAGNVAVQEQNTAPIANFSFEFDGITYSNPNNSVTLNDGDLTGSTLTVVEDSFDAQGDAVNVVSWNLVAGGACPSLTGTTVDLPTSPLSEGLHSCTVELIVSDGQENSNPVQKTFSFDIASDACTNGPISQGPGVATGDTWNWDAGNGTIPACEWSCNAEFPNYDEVENKCNSLCGNGVIDTGEACDGTDFGIATCDSEAGTGYTGSLTCTSSCTIDTAACEAPANPVITPPSQNYFVNGGEITVTLQDLETSDVTITNPDSTTGALVTGNKFTPTQNGKYKLSATGAIDVFISVCPYVGDGSECWIASAEGEACGDPDSTGPETGACDEIGLSCVADQGGTLGSWTITADICTGLGFAGINATPANSNYSPHIKDNAGSLECVARDVGVAVNQDCIEKASIGGVLNFQRACKCQ